MCFLCLHQFDIGFAVIHRWVVAHELDPTSFDQMRRQTIEMMCLMERDLPTSFFNMQEHLLIHIVDEVALAGVVSSRWMFFFERYMKVLKGFVRQKARPEGSMAEGWLVQESMYYVTEYLTTIHPTAPRMWSDEEDEKMIGEVLQGNGKKIRLKEEVKRMINTFVVYNSEVMQPWLDKYDLERQGRTRGRRRGRRHRQESQPPQLPEKCSLEWLREAMRTAEENGVSITNEETEIAYGCDQEVKHLPYCFTGIGFR